MQSVLHTVREKALELWRAQDILDEPISISARPLSVKEAIGEPEAQDFPIQKGKEKLMEATFRESRGQAFTDQYGNYSGSLADVAGLPLESNFNRAIFVSALNAVARAMDQAENTVHCRDTGPQECAQRVFDAISEQYGTCKVTIIGFQPTLAEAMSEKTQVRLVDLDPDNIGKVKRGILIEDGSATTNAIDWCDVLLVTGTTLANDTIDMFLTDKPVFFYGTTIAGAASLMGWKRFCPMSS